MKREVAQQFMKTGGTFQSEYNFKKLSQYLIPIPDQCLLQEPECENYVKRVLKSVHNLLINEIPKINESTDILNTLDAEFQEEAFEIPESDRFNYFLVAEMTYIRQKIDKYLKLSIDLRHEILNNKIELLKAMLPLLNYINNNPMPIMIKASRLLSPADRTSFVFSRQPLRRLNFLRKKISDIMYELHYTPKPFRSNSRNINFVNNLIDEGLSSKKTGTTYFPELVNEYGLLDFFQMPQSPLAKELLWPIPEENELSSDFIRQWIDNATVSVAAFVKTEDVNRADIIAILLQRFIFNALYPKIYPSPTIQNRLEKYAKNVSVMRKKTPKDFGIKLKYVKQGYEDRPITDLFSIDEVSKAPIEWINSANFAITPIDIAYIFAKAHESLSMMCVLRASNANHASEVENFMDKMPGFDDIIEIWMAMMCSCDIPDPFRLMLYVQEFSNLPGFKGRLMSAVSYFEASIIQIEQETC